LGIILHQKPELNNPDMIVGWPGIGNVGIITIETLRQAVQAEELGENLNPGTSFTRTKSSSGAEFLRIWVFPGQQVFNFKRMANARPAVLSVKSSPPLEKVLCRREAGLRNGQPCPGCGSKILLAGAFSRLARQLLSHTTLCSQKSGRLLISKRFYPISDVMTIRFC